MQRLHLDAFEQAEFAQTPGFGFGQPGPIDGDYARYLPERKSIERILSRNLHLRAIINLGRQ